jgi:hypothetical protein
MTPIERSIRADNGGIFRGKDVKAKVLAVIREFAGKR